MAVGAGQVRAVCEVALADLAGAFPTTQVSGSLAEWAGALASVQRVIDTASAVQDALIVRLAAIEPEVLEDGTVVEGHRALGHAALDTPAIVSGALNVSAVHAERRVRAALALAADGPAGSATETGLGGLHRAMATGRLDSYRAGVIAEELLEAPPPVAATVVAALDGHFESEDSAHLRRRCRRVLTRISPDLLVQRARRAREESGLRRWADEPGVDRWVGTFPSEEAAQAWAAIDALAHRYLAQGACQNLERARAKALTDLVAGNATVDTVLTVTVPATVLPATALPDTVLPDTVLPDTVLPDPVPTVEAADPCTTGRGDLIEVTGPNGNQPVYVTRSWLSSTVEAGTAAGTIVVQVAHCHPVSGALLDGPILTTGSAGESTDATAPADDVDDDHGDARGDGPHCDATTDGRGAGHYRPPRRMAERVRARDRRCRFPGCTIAAVFCDIDHVTPWPHGPTGDQNLICLCRRHHRVKQRRGWKVTVTPDAVATWTDPTGPVRTTHPADALHTSILPAVTEGPAAGASARSATPSRTLTVLPDGPHSELEFLLEHVAAAVPLGTSATWRDDDGTHRIDLQPTSGVLVRDRPTHRRPPRQLRPPTRHRADEPPPF